MVINKVLIPKVIRTKYPDLTGDQVEEDRQHVVVDSVIKNGTIKEVADKRFIRMAGSFVDIDDIHIDLIDRAVSNSRKFVYAHDNSIQSFDGSKYISLWPLFVQ